MRSIVDCVSVVHGDWHDSRSRVKQKLRKAHHGISNFPTKSWPERILRGKFRFQAKIACEPIIDQFFVQDGNLAIFCATSTAVMR